MSEKRFTDVNFDFENSWIKLKDNGDFLIFPISFNDKEEYGLDTLEDLLNGLSDKIDEQQATIKQLRTQLLICQQSKNDGKIQVWQVPPIPKGMRITSFTTSDGEKNE